MAKSPDRPSFGTAGNAGSTAQPSHGYRGITPSATVHAVPEFIWGISAKSAPRKFDAMLAKGASGLTHLGRSDRKVIA